jgi:hypothetical protein
MSVLVDVVAIPTVFKNISIMQEGGKIGMIIFGRFNGFEIFFGLMILLGVLSHQKKSKLMIGLASVLLALSIIYTFYMTPMIAKAGVDLHLVNPNDPQYEILTKNHRFYHSLYRSLDTAKLISLLAFAGLVIRFNLQNLRKENV